MSDCGFYGACLRSDFANIRRFGHMRSSLRLRNVPGPQLLQISQKVTVGVLRKLDFGEKSTLFRPKTQKVAIFWLMGAFFEDLDSRPGPHCPLTLASALGCLWDLFGSEDLT